MEKTQLTANILPLSPGHLISDVRNKARKAPIDDISGRMGKTKNEENIFYDPINPHREAIVHGSSQKKAFVLSHFVKY